MVGLEGSEMVVELVEEVFVLCWHLWVVLHALMSRTIERTPFMWEKGREDKCCPGPESCLLRVRQRSKLRPF